jgi:hypothetical protein
VSQTCATHIPIIVDKDFEGHWVEDLDPEVYHADRTAVNSSSLKTILHSPWGFKRLFIDGLSKPPSDSMKFGTLAHMAILEGAKFRERYVIKPKEFWALTKDNRPTNSRNAIAVQEMEAAWEAQQEGRVIVTQVEYDKLMFMLDSFLGNSDAVEILSNGKTEISGYYADPKTGIRARFRPDFLAFDLGALADVKTVPTADIDWFRRNRVEDKEFMYHFQMSMYQEGGGIITRKPIEYPVWILIENEEPHECVVVPMEVVYQETGMKYYRASMNKLEECIKAKNFPRRPGMASMHASDWFIKQEG